MGDKRHGSRDVGDFGSRGYSNTNGLAPSHFTVFGSEVLFLGGGIGNPSAANSGVWVTNGTSAGTSELSIAGAYPNGLFDLFPPAPNFAALGNKVLFEGADARTQSGLWVTDGTSAGTSEITLAGGSTYLAPTDLTTFGSEVLFNGSGSVNGVFEFQALFKTDGTAAGTSEISVAGAGSLDPANLTAFGSEVLFAGTDSKGIRGLWVTDGTSGGTTEITVARAASGGVSPSNLVVFGTEVLFNGIDAAGHNGLWVTDGTSIGTSEITVAGAGPNGLNPSNFAAFSQNLAGPVLSNVSGMDVYAARGTAITVASAAHVTDPNSTTLVSATVSIVGGTFSNDGDILTAVTSGTSITASYDPSTETLTLTGTDTVSDYQQVLESITFDSSSQNPTDFLSNSTRTVTWVVNDGTASNNVSTAETTTISISHPAPSLTAVAASVGFTEGGAAVTLSPNLTVVDQDSATLASATLYVGGQFFSGSDLLSASTSGTSITASYNGFTEVLTLTGTDTIAHYQQVLDSLTYSNSSNNPTTYGSAPTRTIFWFINDGSLFNNTASSTTVSLTAVNNPPTIFYIGATPSAPEHETVSLASFVGVGDPDNLTLASASLAITGGTFAGDGDVLTANTAGTSITASYNSTTETLTLSGTDTLFHYESVLQLVTFSTGANPTDFGSNPTRTFTWALNDGGASNNLSTPVTSTISIVPPPRNDFNADNISDLLLQNTDGTTQIWEMNGWLVTVASRPT